MWLFEDILNEKGEFHTTFAKFVDGSNVDAIPELAENISGHYPHQQGLWAVGGLSVTGQFYISLDIFTFVLGFVLSRNKDFIVNIWSARTSLITAAGWDQKMETSQSKWQAGSLAVNDNNIIIIRFSSQTMPLPIGNLLNIMQSINISRTELFSEIICEVFWASAGICKERTGVSASSCDTSKVICEADSTQPCGGWGKREFNSLITHGLVPWILGSFVYILSPWHHYENHNTMRTMNDDSSF